MLATIVTVATLVIHLWFLYSSSYEIVWHGVEFEDDEDDDTDATANNNSTPTVNDDTLAFTIARLITDKLDSSNSALKETMSRQADDINSMLRRLSALEAKGATSQHTRHSDGLDSPLLIAAKRRIAHLEELAEVNKRKQDVEIEQLRQEHLSHLQIVRSTREFELDEDTENTFIAAQNIAIDLVNADTLHLDAERTTLRERVTLTENSLIPDLERRLANAKLDWDSCKAKFFELRALIGPYGLPRDIYAGAEHLADLMETHTTQIGGVLDAIKGNPLVSGIIYTYPTADDETVTQTCDTISGGDMRLMRSTLSGPSAPSQDVGQSGSQEQPGINNSASSSMVQPESIHNDLQNTGLDCYVPLPGLSSTGMPDASSEVPLPEIYSTSLAHDELEPHPTTSSQLDTHPTSYPSPATSGSDAQDEAIECRPSAFQIPPSQTTSPFGLQEGSAPLQSKSFVFTFTPGTSRAPATENPAGGSSKEQSTAPFSFSAQSPSPSPTGHEPATSTDPQRTASPSPPPPSPSPSPTTSPFEIQEEIAPLQPETFRFSFSPGSTTAPATQSPNRASPEYQSEPGPGTQLPHPLFPYPTAHVPKTDPRPDGVHLQHSSPSPSLFTLSPTASGPSPPLEKKKSSKKKKNRRY